MTTSAIVLTVATALALWLFTRPHVSAGTDGWHLLARDKWGLLERRRFRFVRTTRRPTYTDGYGRSLGGAPLACGWAHVTRWSLFGRLIAERQG